MYFSFCQRKSWSFILDTQLSLFFLLMLSSSVVKNIFHTTYGWIWLSVVIVMWYWASYLSSQLKNSDLQSLCVVVQLLCQIWIFATPWKQHARLPCPSLSPGVCINSWPLSQWCDPTISSSLAPFFSCSQSLPVSGFFPVSQLFTSRGPSIVTSSSASVLPMNIQDWFPLGRTGWISLQSKGLSRVSNITVQSISSLVLNFLYGPPLTSIHDYWKNHSFD